jgi:hypothetical protein
MARNALFNPNSLIPIYVNLTHWRSTGCATTPA